MSVLEHHLVRQEPGELTGDRRGDDGAHVLVRGDLAEARGEADLRISRTSDRARSAVRLVLTDACTDTRAVLVAPGGLTELARLLANVEDEARISAGEDLCMDGDIYAAKLRERRRPVETAIGERLDRIASLKGESALDRFSGRISESWPEFSTDEQRMVISALVLAIWVNPAEKRGFNLAARGNPAVETIDAVTESPITT